VDWVASPAGFHDIYVAVDYPPPGAIAEIDESNNKAFKTIEVLQVLYDYIPWNTPSASNKIGTDKTFSIDVDVKNQGNLNPGVSSTIAFYNSSTPSSPFFTFNVPGINSNAVFDVPPGTWVAPSVPGSYDVIVRVDHGDDISEEIEDNNNYTITFDVRGPPSTSIVIGSPKVGTAPVYVKSSTLVNLNIVDNSGEGAAIFYKIDSTGAWTNYTATGQFTVPSEGEHTIFYYGEDYLGSIESVNQYVLRADNTPPASSISIGEPKFRGSSQVLWNVTSSTPIQISSSDGGATPVGLQKVEYRVDSGKWVEYSVDFTIDGIDGIHKIEYRGMDLLNNLEPVNEISVNIDNTPPITSLTQSEEPLTIDSFVYFQSFDLGSGVKSIQYSFDGVQWLDYSLALEMEDPGPFSIVYRGVDNLGNAEPPSSFTVNIPYPPPESENWKPLVALIFALVIAILGWITVWKRPPYTEKTAFQNWIRTSMIFMIAEAVTGIVSFFTGALSIPPILGLGTAVDVTILILGLLFPPLVSRFLVKKRASAPIVLSTLDDIDEEEDESKEQDEDMSKTDGSSGGEAALEDSKADDSSSGEAASQESKTDGPSGGEARSEETKGEKPSGEGPPSGEPKSEESSSRDAPSEESTSDSDAQNTEEKTP
jgi:hypothetical protein